eukprot:6500125-Pyramimonas_sp.AAC.2
MAQPMLYGATYGHGAVCGDQRMAQLRHGAAPFDKQHRRQSFARRARQENGSQLSMKEACLEGTGFGSLTPPWVPSWTSTPLEQFFVLSGGIRARRGGLDGEKHRPTSVPP